MHCVPTMYVTLYMMRILRSIHSPYRKVLKFSNARKLSSNLPKIQEKRPNLWVFHQKVANGIANSKGPDPTAPLGTV